ncbi:hypothetical protein GKE82_24390 [Conexibacter sp. W3-3-2]|uniref:hypothetical protein n=1 Tax=Conexibacter sp. W3-3-2 TaxID=2675227 RepID=UPI0012B7640D|nr:hypothetical protein [Conexibacter sp. W3-3-2]
MVGERGGQKAQHELDGGDVAPHHLRVGQVLVQVLDHRVAPQPVGERERREPHPDPFRQRPDRDTEALTCKVRARRRDLVGDRLALRRE